VPEAGAGVLTEAVAEEVAEPVLEAGAGVLTEVITRALARAGAGVGAGVSARFLVEKALPSVR